MRVIVCGSRRLHHRHRNTVANRLADLPGTSTVVVGYNPEKDTPSGADRFAYQEAQKLGLLVEPHPAKWEEQGKAAGFIRNNEMAQAGADLCIAFWDGRSNGTKHMMDLAAKYEIPVELNTISASEEEL